MIDGQSQTGPDGLEKVTNALDTAKEALTNVEWSELLNLVYFTIGEGLKA